MPYIYKITNDINGKIYIGKTLSTIEQRFKEHCQDYLKERNEKRPLYNAMKKYGIEHFHISIIEECDESILSEREIFWIDKLNTYYTGYNATLGGDGKILYNYSEIAKRLKEYPYAIQVAKEFNCHPDTIKNIAHIYHIQLKSLYKEDKKKQIARLDKNTEKVLEIYESLQDAMLWCVKNKYCPSCGTGVASHISDAAKGKRKTAYKFKWKFI